MKPNNYVLNVYSEIYVISLFLKLILPQKSATHVTPPPVPPKPCSPHVRVNVGNVDPLPSEIWTCWRRCGRAGGALPLIIANEINHRYPPPTKRWAPNFLPSWKQERWHHKVFVVWKKMQEEDLKCKVEKFERDLLIFWLFFDFQLIWSSDKILKVSISETWRMIFWEVHSTYLQQHRNWSTTILLRGKKVSFSEFDV